MRATRRKFLGCVSVLCCLGLTWSAAGQTTTPGATRRPGVNGSTTGRRGSGRKASLRDTLRYGLRARRTVEFKFIDAVVKLVETKKLPEKLVLETFYYARKKPTRYPFQYFQRAIAIRAARMKVKITIV